uniref:Ribonuclease E n=1 Tax=Corallina ferreyrae TaxID=2547422 RepID=A0A482CG62_9FLOR|nr:ribonuclease E [Corallina ferreyrae]QBL75572.1 ribonuclease E [Corallina ferreyrae]
MYFNFSFFISYFSIMIKKIVISRFNNIAAILQHSKTQEIISVNHDYQINDIYLGSVNKIFTSINAAFINLGLDKKSGFIHMNDIKSLKKNHSFTRISEILSINQLILVQIIKEPTLNKGPRLTANINLFGRYIVLMPFCNTINISRKIYDQNERSYLQALAILLKPATMGLLIRSSASGVNEEVLLEDFRFLKQQWYFIQKLAITMHIPSLLYRDEDLIKKIVRDCYKDNIRAIITDSENSLKQVRYYLNKWRCISPSSNLKLKLYKYPESVLDKFSINTTILNSLKPKVNLAIGGYLFIETYEALTVIDVNSGSFNKTDNSKETVLRTNCYAATEIAYQLKVRNINGVIIIDFIDMESHRDQLQLLEHFTRVLSFDNAKPQIIQLSKLGLVELTRRRRGQSLFELFHSKNNKYFTSLNPSLSINKDNLKKNTIIYKNINTLFFNPLFCRNIFISKRIVYMKNRLKIVSLNLDRIDFLQLRYTFIVPLVLYSEIIDVAFKPST